MTLQIVNKKHIVLLTDCLADLAGGAEKQIYELAKGLDKNLYEVHVVSLETWGKVPRTTIESTGSHLHIFRVVRIYGFSGLFQGIRFYQFLKEKRIDVLMTYHFSSDIWGTFWGHLAGVKTIISNRRDMGFWRNGLHIAAYKWVNPWVTKIVTVSESIKQLIIKEEGLKPQKIEVIYNGVKLPDTKSKNPKELRTQLGLRDDDLVIMHVANLKPVKGHRYLLEAFAGIDSGFRRNDIKKYGNDNQIKLVLIGKDELNGQIQNMAKELNILDKVLFLGKRDNAKEFLKVADICVLPSLSEGMSNSILEYMAAQKPVVATRVGGNPELITDGINGILVEKENTKQLQKALIELVSDQTKRLKMGSGGYEIAKNFFSMPQMVTRYENLFSGIRVLHLISSGGLFGAERVILNLAAKSEGITSFVGAVNNTHNPHLEIIEEARKLNLNAVVFDSKGKFDLTTIGIVKKFITDNKIDIVHTHNYKSDIIGFFASKLARVKWVATNHLWHSTDEKLKVYERIDAKVLRYAKKVIGVSEEIKKDLLKKKLKQERVTVIDNGIPIDKFSHPNKTDQFRTSFGLTPEDCVVAIVGRLAPEKGHEVFLKAAVEVIKKIPHVKFIIVGDGPLKEKLEEQALSLNLSGAVFFAGMLEDMPAIYASCDILVNASFTEGLPMTILEAMASHLAIIATKVGAVGDVIKDEENGILINPGDANLLAQKIIDLVQDQDKRKRLAERAFQDVSKNFSDQRMAERYKEIYLEIASSSA